MKKAASIIILLLTLGLLLFNATALADETDTLYPVRVDGLWGYMNRQGEMVIEPQFTDAGGFRGNYAVVSLPDENWWNPRGVLYGIIDRQGHFALEPTDDMISSRDERQRYLGGRDEGIYIIRSLLGHAGFFDIPTGFYSGLIYDDVDGDWDYADVDEELVCVTMDDQKGFANRKDGSIQIPCQYDSRYYYRFSGDYCVVLPADAEVADGFIMINRKGDAVPLPEHCFASNGAEVTDAGLILIWEMADENAQFEDRDGLYGYADLDGNIVIAPQFRAAYDFQEDRALVALADGPFAIITPENETVMTLTDEQVWRGGWGYQHGLLRHMEYSEDKELQAISYLDRNGKEAFRLEMEDLLYADDFRDNGVSFYCLNDIIDAHRHRYRTGLINDQGEILTSPIFWTSDIEDGREYHEGLYSITDAVSGEKGYINERGEWVIAPKWSEAWDFYHGWAMVRTGERYAYIDHDGQIVWEESAE